MVKITKSENVQVQPKYPQCDQRSSKTCDNVTIKDLMKVLQDKMEYFVEEYWKLNLEINMA